MIIYGLGSRDVDRLFPDLANQQPSRVSLLRALVGWRIMIVLVGDYVEPLQELFDAIDTLCNVVDFVFAENRLSVLLHQKLAIGSLSELTIVLISETSSWLYLHLTQSHCGYSQASRRRSLSMVTLCRKRSVHRRVVSLLASQCCRLHASSTPLTFRVRQ